MVVSYRNSTSNHNVEPRRVAVCVLYLIEILHQTTTITSRACSPRSCILSKFYIKPQPKGSHKRARYGCILSKFYIKPQLKALPQDNKTVVSYRNSTSNHNYPRNICLGIGVVSYRNSTSNHNTARAESRILQLYLIEILHQTTTSPSPICACCMLYLIEILHQTTTVNGSVSMGSSLYLIEILHQTTTVSPDTVPRTLLYLIEILHQTTTPLAAGVHASKLYLIEILHQTTTTS